MIDNLGVTVVDNRPPPPPTQFEIDLARFKEDIRVAINTNGMESYLGAPDFIIAEFLTQSFVNLCKMNASVYEHMEKKIE